MTWRVLLLAGLLLTTGCIGMGGDDSDAETASTDDPARDLNETETEAEEPTNTTEFSTETIEGSVTGIGIPVVGSVTVTPASENNVASFTVDENPRILYLNLTTEGGELDMLLAGPNCEQASACEEEIATSGGEAAYTNETPTAGEHDLRFFSQGPTDNQVSYTLEITQGVLVPADEAR